MPDEPMRRTVLKSVLGAAVLSGQAPALAAQSGGKAGRMSEDLTADEIRRLLGLEPNATCGYVRETFRSKTNIGPGGLPAPFADGRPLGSALYFMVTPDQHVKLHRIRNDQLYH